MEYINALALRLSYETGLRIGDILKIKRGDIVRRLNHYDLNYIAEKTEKSGTVSVSIGLMNRLLQIGGTDYIFPHRLDKDKHRTRQAVWKDMRKACRKYSITGTVSPHSARKCFGVNVYQEQGLTAAKKALQHDRDSTTFIYALADKIDEDITRHKSIDSDDFAKEVADKILKEISNILEKRKKH